MIYLNPSQKPEKKLTEILKKHSGRDNTGKISVRHQGGRQKRRYRVIDFKRNKFDIPGVVISIEYDPNRNANIALIEYSDKQKGYIIHPNNLKIGDCVIASNNAEITVGNSLPLYAIPVGIEIHNIELYKGQGGSMIRGAGTFATVVAKDNEHVQVKLMSGEVRRFQKDCRATIGRVGNIEHKDEIIGSAGRKILMGIRPTVRGTAQNPRSHPHGGGEGRSGEGMHAKTPWGKRTRGVRTRKRDKWSNKLIVSRRK